MVEKVKNGLARQLVKLGRIKSGRMLVRTRRSDIKLAFVQFRTNTEMKWRIKMTAKSRQELKAIAAERLASSAEELVEKIQGRYVFYLSARRTDAPVGWMGFYGSFNDTTVDEARRLLQEKIPDAQVKCANRPLLYRLFNRGPNLYARLD